MALSTTISYFFFFIAGYLYLNISNNLDIKSGIIPKIVIYVTCVIISRLLSDIFFPKSDVLSDLFRISLFVLIYWISIAAIFNNIIPQKIDKLNKIPG